MRLQFISDVFVAVAVVLLKLPNVVMTETSYQMLEVLLFCDPSLKITALKDNTKMTINADTVADAQRRKMLVNLAKLRKFIRSNIPLTT